MQEEQEQMEDMDPDQDLMWQLNRSCSLENDQVDVSSSPQLFPPCRVVCTINATRK